MERTRSVVDENRLIWLDQPQNNRRDNGPVGECIPAFFGSSTQTTRTFPGLVSYLVIDVWLLEPGAEVKGCF
jgi:hypothetical protein